MEIILDFGSGNTCRNDKTIVKRMIDELAKVDKKRQCIIKWQLFKNTGDNIPLERDVFLYAYDYARKLGFKTTASIFDEESLCFLLYRDIPFIKIANNRSTYHLVDKIPRTMPVYISYDNEAYLPKCLGDKDEGLYCISKYPANIEDYKEGFPAFISDHTVGTYFFRLWGTKIIEKHYKLKDSTGLDAGPWAITPSELKEVLK